MDITDAITTDYVEHPPDTPVSKLVGTFDDPGVQGVVVADDEFRGVVTRRQLATSHHKPNQKLDSLVWHVPRIEPDDNIRDVAALMLDSDSRILPVFTGDELEGVVTVDTLLGEVQEFLDAARVEDTYSTTVHMVEPDTSFAKALNMMREYRGTHLPVVNDTGPQGVLSLYDVVGVTIRAEHRSQGGDADGVEAQGQEIADRAANTQRGGYGAREGERLRVLDMPVRDVMTRPTRTVSPTATLQTAVDEMFDDSVSSLVVTDGDNVTGIVTKTDVLETLTWEEGGNRAVQVYGTSLLKDVSYDEVVGMIEKFDDRDHGMSIIDAKIHLQKHEEQHRGTPLILARIRLDTDNGLFMAEGEGYGAKQALNDARKKLERRIRDQKTHGNSKKPPGEEFWEKRFGWLLEEA